MNKYTETIVTAALASDPGTKNKIGQVMQVLNGPSYLPKYIGEGDAATILGISRAALSIWRRGLGKYPAFPFSLIETCGSLLYDENELLAYIRNNTKKGSLSHEA